MLLQLSLINVPHHVLNIININQLETFVLHNVLKIMLSQHKESNVLHNVPIIYHQLLNIVSQMALNVLEVTPIM